MPPRGNAALHDGYQPLAAHIKLHAAVVDQHGRIRHHPLRRIARKPLAQLSQALCHGLCAAYLHALKLLRDLAHIRNRKLRRV